MVIKGKLTMEKVELKPCPFCNGKARMDTDYNDPFECGAIYCVDCGAKIEFGCGGELRFKGIEAWNRRVDDGEAGQNPYPRYLIELKVYLDDPEDDEPCLQKTIRAFSNREMTFNDELVFNEAIKYIKDRARRNSISVLKNWEKLLQRDKAELRIPCCYHCWLKIQCECHLVCIKF